MNAYSYIDDVVIALNIFLDIVWNSQFYTNNV